MYVFNVVLAAIYIVNNGIDVFELQRGEKRLKRKAVERLIVYDQNFHPVKLAVRVCVGVDWERIVVCRVLLKLVVVYGVEAALDGLYMAIF